MKQTELAGLLSNLAIHSAEKALAMTNALKTRMTRADAYRLYGRANVDRWVSEGLIRAAGEAGKSSKQVFNKAALERVAASSNRITYKPVADR